MSKKVVLKDINGNKQTFSGVNIIRTKDTSGNFNNRFFVPEGAVDITENSTVDVTNYASAVVNVPIPEGYIKPSGTLEITSNGSKDVTEYASVNVAVPSDEPVLIEKTISQNGEYKASKDNADGYSKVTVAIPEAKLQEKSVSIVENGTTEITPDGGYDALSKVSVTVNVAGEVLKEYDGTVVIVKPEPPQPTGAVIGVTGLRNENGALTLTDDAAGVAAYSTTTSGDYVSVVNPLSAFFPFNEISEFTDSYGNAFIKYPKLYLKYEQDSDGMLTGYKISKTKIDDTYFVPDAFLDPRDATGSTYLDYFALGKYEMSISGEGKARSDSGKACYVECTIGDARTAARAYGNDANYYGGYQQLDFAQWSLYNLLCMMYYQTTNIQKVWGGRTGAVQRWSSASITGTCDGVAGLDGWNTATNCTKMLGIECPYDNIFKWVDGFWAINGALYAQRYPKDYGTQNNIIDIGFAPPRDSEYLATALKNGTTSQTRSYVFIGAGTNEVGEEPFNQYMGDVYYVLTYSDGCVPVVGGVWGYSLYCGLWFAVVNSSVSRSASSVGGRLALRPL